MFSRAIGTRVPLKRVMNTQIRSMSQIYNQGDNLTTPNVNLNLYVINLTKSGAKYVTSTGLSKAIDALNAQVKNDFAPAWGSKGTLIDMTANFGVHLSNTQQKSIISADPETVADALVSWIVANNASKHIDWKTSGIIYLTDYGSQDFGGVHMDDVVKSIDIPYALVTVPDANWTVTLSHEVLELLADPWGFRFMKQSQYSIGKWTSQNWILEVCDACEAVSYPGVNGVLVSDFVLPAYFNVSTPDNTPLDFQKKLFRNTKLQPTAQFPYPMLDGGYLSFLNPSGSQFSQITWFDGTKPVYTAPVSATGSAAHDHKKYGRLTKYLDNHNARRIHHRLDRLHGKHDV